MALYCNHQAIFQISVIIKLCYFEFMCDFHVYVVYVSLKKMCYIRECVSNLVIDLMLL